MAAPRIGPQRPLDVARAVIAVSLFILGVGTLAGSSPGWPDPTVYAIAAFIASALWLLAALKPGSEEAIEEIAAGALVALGIMRCSGYLYELLTGGPAGLLAAVGAWVIVVSLAARPLLESRFDNDA